MQVPNSKKVTFLIPTQLVGRKGKERSQGVVSLNHFG